jgi:hypothetical protein
LGVVGHHFASSCTIHSCPDSRGAVGPYIVLIANASCWAVGHPGSFAHLGKDGTLKYVGLSSDPPLGWRKTGPGPAVIWWILRPCPLPDRWRQGPPLKLPHSVASCHLIGARQRHLHNPTLTRKLGPRFATHTSGRQHQHGPGPELNRDLGSQPDRKPHSLPRDGTSHSSFAQQSADPWKHGLRGTKFVTRLLAAG